MKTITTRKIKADTDNIQFGYYDLDEDAFVAVESTPDIIKAAEKLLCSPELLTALILFVDIVRDRVGYDLRAIWKRLDETGL